MKGKKLSLAQYHWIAQRALSFEGHATSKHQSEQHGRRDRWRPALNCVIIKCYVTPIYRAGCVRRRRPGSIQPAAKHRLARDAQSAYYSLIDVAMQPTVQSESVIIEITTCSHLSLLLYIIPAPIYIIIATTTERR
jgi:hypothetical protein